jgi:uncharacterized protein YndB with AHSA1/START domain
MPDMQIVVDRFIDAVSREVIDREFQGQPARAVVIRRSYPTNVEDLWDALTNAERLPRWFLPLSGDLRLGGRYQFGGNAGGEITACDPPRSFSVTWEFGDNPTWLTIRFPLTH